MLYLHKRRTFVSSENVRLFRDRKSAFLCVFLHFRANKKPLKVLIFSGLRFCAYVLGGEDGIRTHDTLLGYTHFPGVRHRPTRPPLQFINS